ncbi:CidA/LrgA family protein [Vibrio hippocampi]|uniref:CidA/LrgA family protein n=1 Tax=Vibrio hippocampi TaxID=654686 RepID=UPI001F00A091|nr:CidA/LrgA family protein [Vibrio hippocampi]
MIQQLLRYIVSFALIFVALFLGKLIQAALGVSIPGSIFGMLILFTAMASGLLSVKWVQPGASAFIRYMILLFVPISVGLVNHLDLLADNALAIVAGVIGGSLLVLMTLSLLLQKILTKGDK